MTKLEIEEVKLKILGNKKLEGKSITFTKDGNIVLGDMKINISELDYIRWEFEYFRNKLLNKAPSELK